MKLSCIKKFLVLTLIGMSLNTYARDHLIFSVAEDIPMGWQDDINRRNYYVTMGSEHGIKKGTTLTVFRRISKRNPYDNKKRVNYKVPIGTLEVIHAEDTSAIGNLKKLYKSAKDPLFEINNFMIGDSVEVKVN